MKAILNHPISYFWLYFILTCFSLLIFFSLYRLFLQWKRIYKAWKWKNTRFNTIYNYTKEDMIKFAGYCRHNQRLKITDLLNKWKKTQKIKN